MSARTALWLTLAALVLTGLNALLAWREAVARQDLGRDRRLFTLNPEQIETIRVYRGPDLYAEFTRGERIWQVEFPALKLKDTADARAVEELCALIELSRRAPVEIVPAAAGLEDRGAATQVVAIQGNRSESLFLGRVTPDGKTVYASTDRETKLIHALPADLTAVCRRDGASLRSLDLFDLTRQEPDRISLIPEGADGFSRRITLERAGAEWVLTHPVRWPVAEDELDRLLRLLRGLRAQAVVAESAADVAPFGLSEGSPSVLIALGDREQTVRFGGPCRDPGGVFAQRQGRPAVFAVLPILSEEAKRNQADRYRRRDLRLLADQAPAVIEVVNHQGRLRLTRQAAGWVAGGDRDFAVDPSAVQNLLGAVRTLSVLGFTSENSAGPLGEALKTAPDVRLSFCDPTGKELAGLALKLENDHAYGQVAGLPQIFQFEQDACSGLMPPLVYFRSRRLAQFDYRQIQELAIETGGARRVYRPVNQNYWQLYQPETRLLEEDGLRFFRLVCHLSELSALSQVNDRVENWAEFGLDHPQVHVVVTLRSSEGAKDSGRVVLDLLTGRAANLSGGADNGNRPKMKPPVYARLAGEDGLFLLPAELIADLEKDYR